MKLAARKLVTIRRVVGNSMAPVLRPGAVVVALPLPARVGDVVVARQAGREVIKRVQSMHGSDLFLVGDNTAFSTDSRTHGTVPRGDCLGRVIYPWKISRISV